MQGTELPFSTSGGKSSLTLPFFTGASPMTARTASCIISGVAAAGRIESCNSTPQPASAPAVLRISRRERSRSISGFTSKLKTSLQGYQIGNDVLDFHRREHRLVAKHRRHSGQVIDAIERRHNGRRIGLAGIDDAQPQLSF